MELIYKYFPELSEKQKKQLAQLKPLYVHWNSQINVISRKDMDDFYERHVLHSLAIAKYISFLPNTKILDVGTGGGFPGIPLAILFPEVDFYLVDSIGKKIKVVAAVVEELGLQNVKAVHQRAEDVEPNPLAIGFDFIVSRAVTKADKFVPWVTHKIKKKSHNKLKNGFIFLKGGALEEEFAPLKKYFNIQPIQEYFEEDFFVSKQIVYLRN